MKRSNEEILNSANKAVESMSTYINLSLGAVMDIADFYITDCVEEMRKKGIYRQRAKMLVTNVVNSKRNLLNLFIVNVADMDDLYMEAIEIIKDDVDPHIKTLRYSIKNALDGIGADNTGLCSDMVTVHVLLLIGIHTFDAIVGRLKKKTGINQMGKLLRQINPRPVWMAWLRVMEEVCKFSDGTLDAVCLDKNVALGARIVTQRLTNEEYLEQSCRKIVDRLGLEMTEAENSA